MMNFEVAKEVGRKIEYFRKKREIDRNTLAQYLKITPEEMKSIETGDTILQSSTVEKISIFLAIPVQEIFPEQLINNPRH